MILAAGVMATHLDAYRKPPESPIGRIVKTVVSDPSWSGRRIMVASDLEGAMIAEFAAQDLHRPGHELLRPGKLLARQDWFGHGYVSRYQTVEEMAAWFAANPVALIVWHSRPPSLLRTHERLMGEMLSRDSLSWHKIALFPQTGGDGSTWSIYEFVSPKPTSTVSLIR